MNRYRRRQNRQGVIAVALALVLAVGMWGGQVVAPQGVAAAMMSPATGGGCSTASFMKAAGSPFGTGNGPFSVAVGDFNGDGKPDLAIANYGDNNVTILLGDGLGGFSQPAGSPVGAGSGPQSVAVGDFNGDGKLDLAVANYSDDNVTIRLGDGAGGFPDAKSSTVGAGDHPDSVAVGDFNGDGKLDLAVANLGGGVTIRLGDGAGAFPTSANVGAGTQPRSVAVGDFNGDGKLDLAVANYSDNNVTIRLGDGAGGFPDAKSSTVGAGDHPDSVAVGDFNGDGKRDLAVANDGFNGTVTILLGDGAGAFPTSANVGAGTQPRSVAVGDFNGDGKLDLAVANAGSNNVTIRLGDGTGGFSQPAGSPVGAVTNPQSVAVGDFNGDGKPDLAVANIDSNNVTVQLNTCDASPCGGISFAPPTGSPFGAGTHPRSVAVGDFNGDGKPDLAVANERSANVTIRLGDGLGGFSQPAGSPVGAGTNPQSVAVGDFNGDGKLDLAIANYSDNNVTIRLGDGAGGFPDAKSSTVGAGTSADSVAVGDFNGDGKPDLAVANFNSDNVTILLGDGLGGFSQPASSTVGAGTNPASVAVGDFNGDGKPDLAVANYGDNNVTVQLNTCTANHPPVANAGPDQTVECAGATSPVTLDGSASSDPDADPLTYSWSEAGAEIATSVSPTVQLSSGPHTLTLTVTDPSNASAIDSLTVTVVDTKAPTITLNGANPLTVECHTSFTDPGATATDACAGAVSVQSSGSVNVNAPGSYTITYSATDGTNAATATRTVKVVDTTAPALTLKPDIQFWPPNHMYQTVTMNQMVAGVSDGCSTGLGLNDVVIEKVTSDEPDDAPGSSDGSTTKDIVIAADCKSMKLRAERDETKNGRVYVVTLRVRDAAGNTTRKDFKISVPISPGSPAVQDAAAQTKTSRCSN